MEMFWQQKILLMRKIKVLLLRKSFSPVKERPLFRIKNINVIKEQEKHTSKTSSQKTSL